MVEALLSVNHLRTALPERRGGRRRREVEYHEIVRGVSFHLQPGKVLGIIGESGSGKSATCLSILRLFRQATIQGSVQLAGIGKLKLGERAERQGRNPSTGEAITIKASKTVKFSGGKRFKDSFQ